MQTVIYYLHILEGCCYLLRIHRINVYTSKLSVLQLTANFPTSQTTVGTGGFNSHLTIRRVYRSRFLNIIVTCWGFIHQSSQCVQEESVIRLVLTLAHGGYYGVMWSGAIVLGA